MIITMETLNQSILIIVSIIIFYCILGGYTEWICDTNNQYREPFVDDYYHWNWNEANMITKMNEYTTNPKKCKDCSYSISCDFTDDAQSFCYRAHDVPYYNEKINMLFNSSY